MRRISAHCAIAVGSLSGDKAEEAAQRRQTAVACTDRVSTFLLCILQKGAHLQRGEVGQYELGYRSLTTLGDESKEQAPSVAVGANGMDGSIPLLDHPLVKEGVQQPGERVDRLHGVHPFRYMQAMCSECTEALVCLLQEILGDGDIDQRRMDIAVPEIGRQERELVLRIDAGAIPLQNAVHDHRVTQVVNARTSLALRRLDPGAPQYVDEARCDALRRVACVSLIVPEQSRNPGFAAPSPRVSPRDIHAMPTAHCRSKGRILDLKNFVSRMVIVPDCRSTSPRSRRASSPIRNPAQ